jgi:hydroxymethylbilane synthase
MQLKKVFKIVSRKSRLALQQANIVQQKLLALYPELKIEIIGISTMGDQILDQPLTMIGGKGLFVKELEQHLLQEQADIAVHSMKDVPSELPEDLAIGAILERADPRDVLVSLQHMDLHQLPLHAVVGTSSLRRQAQLLAARSDLVIEELRGNIETRLEKLLKGRYQAIVLAAAGLERLGLKQWLSCHFRDGIMLPAVGQGALGIEYRKNDLVTKELIEPLNHPNTAYCVIAERAMNAKLEGGCLAPIAGLAKIKDHKLALRGLVASADGQTIYLGQEHGNILDADAIGRKVAEKLIAQGADKIIQALKAQAKNSEQKNG